MCENKKMAGKMVSVNIVSPDPKRLADFYRDVLGANVDESRGGPDRIEICFGSQDCGDVVLVANRDPDYTPVESRTCRGIELRVDDVDALYKRMLELGVKTKGEPQEVPWGFRFICIQDPDGSDIDLVQQL